MSTAAVSRLIAAGVCMVSACAASPAFASTRLDAAATRAYLRASYTYARDEYSQATASVDAVQASASEIAAACPGALTYAPRDAAFSELGEEAFATLSYSASAPLRPIILRLGQAIAHLSWSNRALTRLVRARAAEELEVASATSPDMCAEIEAWKAGAYAALPSSASAFVTRFGAMLSSSAIGPSEEQREAVILRRLGRYESRAERALGKRIGALEARLGRRVSAAIMAGRAKIAAALGVSAL